MPIIDNRSPEAKMLDQYISEFQRRFLNREIQEENEQLRNSLFTFAKKYTLFIRLLAFDFNQNSTNHHLYSAIYLTYQKALQARPKRRY
jgi:hypothetical protein